MSKCECGCGGEASPGCRFIYGHNRKGKTKENDESIRRAAEKNTGLTKENDEGRRITSEKMTGKIPTTAMIGGHKRAAEKLTGRTKENYEGVRRQSEKMKGRTKEDYEYLQNHSEQMKNNTGELSPNWQGGLSFEPYCEKFDNDLKERVRDFFGRCCYVCGKNEEDNGQKLSIHHVNYDKMGCCNDVKPLFVPLCKKCHAKTHGNRKYWEEFFTVSLNYLTDGECFTKK